MSDMQISFGERIKQARERKGLSAAELAAALSVSETTVSQWETSEQELPDEITRKIVGALDISIRYLLGDSENPEYKPIPPAKKKTPERMHPERRRRERLWLRDLAPSAPAEHAPRHAFTCLAKCRELHDALLSEGGFATGDDLKSLIQDLERARAVADRLMRRQV